MKHLCFTMQRRCGRIKPLNTTLPKVDVLLGACTQIDQTHVRLSFIGVVLQKSHRSLQNAAVPNGSLTRALKAIFRHPDMQTPLFCYHASGTRACKYNCFYNESGTPTCKYCCFLSMILTSPDADPVVFTMMLASPSANTVVFTMVLATNVHILLFLQ